MAANIPSITAVPIYLESVFMCYPVFQCIVVNIRFLVAVFKEGTGNGFFRLSVARHTPKNALYGISLFFSDRLKCEDYCCTLYPLICPISRISIPKV